MINSVQKINNTLPKTSQAPVSNKQNPNRSNYFVNGTLLALPSIAGGFLGYSSYKTDNSKLLAQKDKFEKPTRSKEATRLREEIVAKFAYLVVRLKEGRLTEMPNCLLVVGDDPKYCDRVIDWIGKSSGAKYLKVNHDDNLVGILEKSEENFQDNGDWSLIHVKNMDKLIDHSQVKDRVVEGMKDIMSAASEDYHSTMIFQTQDTSKLDSIALQPHRVKKFNLNEVKESDFFATNKNEKEIEEINHKLSKLSKNKKVFTGVAIGAGVGVVLAACIKYGKKIFNKNTKTGVNSQYVKNNTKS